MASLKEGALSQRELALKAIAGLAGGALGWLPVELASHNSHLGQAPTLAGEVANYASAALAAGAIGALITAVDTAVDGARIRLTPPAQRLLIRGFAMCAVLSLAATYLGNYAFGGILEAGGVRFTPGGEMVSGSIVTLVFARLVGWAIDGALVGAGVGLATLLAQNVAKGAVGGLAGGAIGGIAFDLIGAIAGGGAFSRFFGEAATGLAIGLLIGLVQELTKAAWVTVEQGRLRGRQYRIEGARASIGRAEENPVGLFGDPSVQARHAVIERRGADYVLKNLAVKEGTRVNGNRIESADLRDGDRIDIGGYELLFHLRHAAAPARGAPAISPAPAVGAAAGPCLIDAQGNRFAVKAGALTRLGRALDNDIVVGHSSVSRHHASIEANHGAFAIKDLGSQNGTFVGGRRVTATQLGDGDSIRLGDAQFTFRG